MRSLRNVGQIRRVFGASDSKKKLEDVAEDFKGYDFQYALESLNQIQSFAMDENDLRDTDWHILFDSRESEDAMSLVRESEYSPKIYAFILEENDGVEIGITYMEPRLVWLEQAKESYGEEEESESESVIDRSSRRETHRAKQEKIEKKMRERNRERKKEFENSNNNQSSRQDDSDTRIDSNIDKKDLSIILSARIANVLRAGEFNDDFRAITDGYPELKDILQKIYDPESLREHEGKLPYEFTESEIKSICQESKFLRDNSNSSNNNTFELKDAELETVLKE